MCPLLLLLFSLSITSLLLPTCQGNTLLDRRRRRSFEQRTRTLNERRRKLIVYGTDGRQDEEDVSNSGWKNYGKSDVMLVFNSQLSYSWWWGGYYVAYGTQSQSYGTNVGCVNPFPFYNQKRYGFCSGTLIGDRYISTAGHCVCQMNVQYASQCDVSEISVIFGATKSDASDHFFDEDQVFALDSVVAAAYTYKSGMSKDFAIVRLKEAVPTNIATPIPVRLTTRAILGERALLIGHPYGLPRKYDEAFVNYVHENECAFYVWNGPFDSFGGNSGSGVISTDTGELIGVLIEGGTDFFDTTVNGETCKDVNYCQASAATSGLTTSVQYTDSNTGSNAGYVYGEKIAGSIDLYAACGGPYAPGIVANSVEMTEVCNQLRSNALDSSSADSYACWNCVNTDDGAVDSNGNGTST